MIFFESSAPPRGRLATERGDVRCLPVTPPTLDQWIDMSPADRKRFRRSWDPYADGYWHRLLEEAARRFDSETMPHPLVERIHSGVYHGGTLIIGVTTTLPYPEKLDLPRKFADFPVLQFGT